MELPLYQVDAFTDTVFQGNPAAVVFLEYWLPDHVLRRIANENNLSETAFLVVREDDYELRWFTPADEVDLCGHATMAAAHVLFEHGNVARETLRFHTRSGVLTVSRSGPHLAMDFPASEPEAVSIPTALLAGLGVSPVNVTAGFDFIVELDSEQTVQTLKPNLGHWKHLDKRGVVVTAASSEHDFVSRCFFPGLSVNEDPVTGSAHCELAPYWASKLDKPILTGKQLSARSGVVECELIGDRVMLKGQAVTYLIGKIYLPGGEKI
nr:PhzF family phenazine biosynthesis protein [Saliniradius amylolyticus]